MAHPRPWRKAYANTFTANYTKPLFLVAADGRKICTVWGKGDEREETADIILRAVNAYDKVMQKRADSRN